MIGRMARSFASADYPDAAAITELLDADLTGAAVRKMQAGDVVIQDAILRGAKVDIVASVAPRRQLLVMFCGSGPAYRDIEGEVFGEDQKIEKSEVSDGFALAFRANGLSYALTVSGPDGSVEAALCFAPE